MSLPTTSGIFRAGSDPDLRFSPSGTPVAKFRAVASSNRKKDDGTWETTGEIWVTVIAFYDLAEYVANSVVKGQQVTLLGKIQNREYTTDDGEKRYALEVLADAVQPLRSRDSQPAAAPASSGPVSDPSEPPFLVMPERTPFC